MCVLPAPPRTSSSSRARLASQVHLLTLLCLRAGPHDAPERPPRQAHVRTRQPPQADPVRRRPWCVSPFHLDHPLQHRLTRHPLVSPLCAQATPGAVTVKYARSPTRSRSARARRRSAPLARSRRSSRSSTRASTATCLPTCATTAPRSLVRRRRGCAGGQSWRRGSVRCVLSSRSLAAARSSQTDLVFPRRASTAAGTLRCVLFTRSRSIGSGATSLTPNLARSSASTQGGTTLARTRTASLRRPRTASRYGSTRTRRSRSSSGATSRG